MPVSCRAHSAILAYGISLWTGEHSTRSTRASGGSSFKKALTRTVFPIPSSPKITRASTRDGFPTPTTEVYALWRSASSASRPTISLGTRAAASSRSSRVSGRSSEYVRISRGRASASVLLSLILGASPQRKSRRSKRYRPPATQVAPAGARSPSKSAKSLPGSPNSCSTRCPPCSRRPVAIARTIPTLAEIGASRWELDPEMASCTSTASQAASLAARAGFAVSPTIARAFPIVSEILTAFGFSSQDQRAPRLKAISSSVARSWIRKRSPSTAPISFLSSSRPRRRNVTMATWRTSRPRRSSKRSPGNGCPGPVRSSSHATSKSSSCSTSGPCASASGAETTSAISGSRLISS